MNGIRLKRLADELRMRRRRLDVFAPRRRGDDLPTEGDIVI